MILHMNPLRLMSCNLIHFLCKNFCEILISYFSCLYEIICNHSIARLWLQVEFSEYSKVSTPKILREMLIRAPEADANKKEMECSK